MCSCVYTHLVSILPVIKPNDVIFAIGIRSRAHALPPYNASKITRKGMLILLGKVVSYWVLAKGHTDKVWRQAGPYPPHITVCFVTRVPFGK